MQIETQVRGDVVVVTLRGKITLGEGDEALQDAIRSLAQQRDPLKAVIDLTNVPYLDSAGLGEIVRTYTNIYRNRGAMILCHPSVRIVDLLSVTKLRTVYRILPTVDDAVAALGRADHDNQECVVSCPVCEPTQQIPFELGAFFDGQECGVCGNSFRIDRPQTPLVEVDAHTRACVRRMHFPTYPRQSVGLSLEAVSGIDVGSRLDLFTFDVIDLAWQLVPTPRRVLIEVADITEYSDIAIRRLVELSRRSERDSKSAVLTRHAHEPEKATLMDRVLAGNERVFSNGGTAWAALQPHGSTPCLAVDVRRTGVRITSNRI